MQAKGQSHKGRPQGQLPCTPPSFIACQSQSHSPRSMHTRRVTNRSPSALRCHHTVREQKIRYETGWWLGYLTISGLGTLTALQITSNFAGDCIGAILPFLLSSNLGCVLLCLLSKIIYRCACKGRVRAVAKSAGSVLPEDARKKKSSRAAPGEDVCPMT